MKNEGSKKPDNIPSITDWITANKKDWEIEKRLKGGYEIPDFLLKDEITLESKIKDIEPIVMVQDSIYSVKGDFSLIEGLPKTGKTTVVQFIIATGFMKEIPEDFDSLGIRTKYCEGKPIVYFDTEQPKSNTDKTLRSILRMLDLKEKPDNLHIVNLRQYKNTEKLWVINKWMEHVPDTHLWIIDGIADLIRDPNNIEDSFGLIEHFMIQTDKLNTSMIMHLHENPGGGKARGNLGSEAERKCGGAIAIRKKNGTHSIEPKLFRYSEDPEIQNFRYNKVLKRMASVDEDENRSINHKADPKIAKLELRVKLAKRVTLNGKEKLHHKELLNRIIIHSKDIEGKEVSISTGKIRIKEMCEDLDIMKKNELGKYEYIYKEEDL